MLEGGRFPGVSGEDHPLPFLCPFDHLFDIEKWAHSDAPYREYSFLDNPRVRRRMPRVPRAVVLGPAQRKEEIAGFHAARVEAHPVDEYVRRDGRQRHHAGAGEERAQGTSIHRRFPAPRGAPGAERAATRAGAGFSASTLARTRRSSSRT